jgi:general secretion pathway protein G
MNAKQRLCRTGFFRTRSLTAVVLAAVAALLSVVVFLQLPHYVGYAPIARVKGAEVQIANFATALNAFNDTVGRYPTTREGLHALVKLPANVPEPWTKPFMKNIPPDPWGNDYQDAYPGTHNVDSYDLYSFGPDGKPGGGDDITNWWETPTRHWRPKGCRHQ